MRYNALLTETNFLRVKARAEKMGMSMNLLSINYRDNMFVFQTRSQTRPGMIWTQKIQLQGTLAPEVVARANPRELANMILDRHIKVSCGCEAWTYWGFKYKAWMKGYGLERETRRPVVRNPQQRGFLCFPKGTKVISSKGEVNIENLQVGDFVYTHKGRLRKVTSTMSKTVDQLVEVYVDDKKITSTRNHPFYSCRNDSGSIENCRLNIDNVSWTKAIDLKKGDVLLSPLLHDNYIDESKFASTYNINDVRYMPSIIKDVKEVNTSAVVYNISVDEDESYLVDGFAVHNCKHLYQILDSWKFYAPSIATKYQEWYTQNEKK